MGGGYFGGIFFGEYTAQGFFGVPPVIADDSRIRLPVMFETVMFGVGKSQVVFAVLPETSVFKAPKEPSVFPVPFETEKAKES